MTLPRNVRLPRRIRFRNVSDPPIPDDTPPAYDDPAHAQPPLVSSPLDPVPSSSRNSLDGTRPRATVDCLSASASGSSSSLTFRRNGMDADDQDRPPVTPLEAVDPNIIVLFLEDYRRTKEYVRELEWREARRKLFQRHLYKWYAIAIIVITLSALLSAKHDSVVRFTEPLTRHIRSWPAGWLIPIALLIIVSFPPLIGHEIIGILCGLVWGFGEGSGILIAGTFLGEIATWVAFKWFCTVRAKKFEKKNRLYWSLTQLIREKSFMFVLILRFSAVPGHIVTAVSASAGANVYSYCAAAVLTLPKQLTITYLGHAFGTENRKNTIISVCTTVLTLLMTVVAAVYVYYQMRILMRKRNREEAMALPRTVQDLTALTLELDSDVDVDLGRRRTIQCHRGELGAMAEKIALDRDLKGSKPWLFAGDIKDGSIGMEDGISTPGASGSLGRPPQRSRSHPGPMNAGELRAFMTELESQRGTPAPPITLNDDEVIYEPRDSIWLPPPSPGPSSMQSQSPDRADGEYIGLSTHRPRLSRGHSSLDLSHRDRMGGREIADDADAYARGHGANRPTGRGRGESRAALLGRPLDTASTTGSDDGEYFDKAPFTAPPLSNEEFAESRDVLNGLARSKTQPRARDGMGKGKEREYGRSRGESGAALLGRPDFDEASTDGESMKSRRTDI